MIPRRKEAANKAILAVSFFCYFYIMQKMRIRKNGRFEN